MPRMLLLPAWRRAGHVFRTWRSSIIKYALNCGYALRNMHFPFDCCLCREPDSGGSLCTACQVLLPQNRSSCQYCALPESICGPLTELATTSHVITICSSCACANAVAYRRATVPFSYGFPVDYMIGQFKYAGDMTFARVFGEQLAYVLDHQIAQLDEPPEVVVPVPLTLQRLQERGFNQSFELSRVVSGICGLPIRSDVLARHGTLTDRPLPDQRVRSRAVRLRSNSHGYFCRRALTERVLVIDDVMTTGATLEAIAALLIENGARSVDVAAVARAYPTKAGSRITSSSV